MSIALLRQLPFEVRLSYCIIIASKSFPEDSDHHRFFLELLNNVHHGYGEKDLTFFEQLAVANQSSLSEEDDESEDRSFHPVIPDDDYALHKLGTIWKPDPDEEVIVVPSS